MVLGTETAAATAGGSAAALDAFLDPAGEVVGITKEEAVDAARPPPLELVDTRRGLPASTDADSDALDNGCVLPEVEEGKATSAGIWVEFNKRG